MPVAMAVKGTVLGLVGGFFPIGWIIVNVLFLYRMTVDKGHFAVFQHSMGSVTADRRMQLLLARIGVVTIEQLSSIRQYYIVGAFVAAAVVTPPDVVSMLSLAIPLCVLYEVGIIAARIFIRQTQAPPDDAAATTKNAGDKP